VGEGQLVGRWLQVGKGWIARGEGATIGVEEEKTPISFTKAKIAKLNKNMIRINLCKLLII